MSLSSNTQLFFTHPIFKDVFIPVITCFLSIGLKASSKTKFSINRNDLYICFDLCTTALFLFTIGMIDLTSELVNNSNQLISKNYNEIQTLITYQQKIITSKILLSWLILLFMGITTFILSVTTRNCGWDKNGKPKIWFGILIPNIFGLILLIIATHWIKL